MSCFWNISFCWLQLHTYVQTPIVFPTSHLSKHLSNEESTITFQKTERQPVLAIGYLPKTRHGSCHAVASIIDVIYCNWFCHMLAYIRIVSLTTEKHDHMWATYTQTLPIQNSIFPQKLLKWEISSRPCPVGVPLLPRYAFLGSTFLLCLSYNDMCNEVN